MSLCRSCHAEVRWLQTEKGKQMPVDAVPVPDGNIVLRVSAKRRITVAHVLADAEEPRAGEARYVSHFVTCPESTSWRK